MWLLAMIPAFALDCDLRGLGRTIDEFDKAYANLDLQTFQESVQLANRQVGCMTQPLTPVQAANLHRLRAFDAYVSDEKSTTILHFQALQATQPGYTLPTDLVPEDHPMQGLFAEAKQFAAGDMIELAAPVQGRLTVDGKVSVQAPTARPWVFQHLDGQTVLSTSYVDVGAALPTYATLADAPKRSRRSKTFLRIGLATAGAGALVYGGSYLSRRGYDSAVEAGDLQRIQKTHGQTNALAVTGLSVLGVGLGLTGVGFAF